MTEENLEITVIKDRWKYRGIAGGFDIGLKICIYAPDYGSLYVEMRDVAHCIKDAERPQRVRDFRALDTKLTLDEQMEYLMHEKRLGGSYGETEPLFLLGGEKLHTTMKRSDFDFIRGCIESTRVSVDNFIERNIRAGVNIERASGNNEYSPNDEDSKRIYDILAACKILPTSL